MKGRRASIGGAHRWRLLRVQPGKRESVLHEDTRPIVDAAIGEDGALAWLLRAEGDSHVLYRLPTPGLQRALLRCGQVRRCRLLGSAADGGLWLNGNADADLTGLLHIDREGRLRRVHEDPRGEADLDSVALDPVDGQPRLLGYDSTVPQLVARKPADAQRLAALRHQLHGSSLRIEIGADRWLVTERGDRLRGERHWLANPDGSLRPLREAAGFQFRRPTVAAPRRVRDGQQVAGAVDGFGRPSPARLRDLAGGRGRGQCTAGGQRARRAFQPGAAGFQQ